MYEVAVQGSFCATHQVALPDGAMEPLHGHDWGVTAVWGGRQLDAGGMVVDFDEVRRLLTGLLAELNHSSLNEHPWFGGLSASAERVARVVFERLESGLGSGGPSLVSVTVSEAPNCSATYRRD